MNLGSLHLAQAFRHLVVLVTGFLAGSRTVDAVRSWRDWHTWVVRDPSAADAYRSFFLVNAVAALVSFLLAGLVWWLLRPKSQRPAGG
jgi:hypothetical protein